jgi:Zn finger protein HypA/HybF involved in hydrogenase expression
LNAAFVGGNIGIYSNNISKIWNSDIFINGSEEERQEAVDLVRLLCMENNFVIDYAKTLYKPERPSYIHEKITGFTNKKLPHFFTYAKDKTDDQVEDVNNSLVNKLESKIINPRINSRSIGLKTIDYVKLVNNPDIECRVVFNKNGRINEELSDPMIVKYYELNQQYHFKVNMECAEFARGDLMGNTQYKQDLFFKKIANEIRYELSQFGYSESEIVDILVKLLYSVKPSKHKSVLWFCYGKYIFENIEKNIKPKTKIVQCVDCGKWIEVNTKDNETCRCDECYSEYRKVCVRENMKKYREKKKMLSAQDVSANNQ